MSAQNIFIANTECLLDTTYLSFTRTGLKSNRAPRSLNPWPFLAAIALVLLALSLSTARDIRAHSHPFSARPKNPIHAFSVIVGGKARNVSYNFDQNGPKVNVTCSAANEIGDVQTIEQNFDIRNPKQFEVQQKKNGKLLKI